jgi:hypothetical protein
MIGSRRLVIYFGFFFLLLLSPYNGKFIPPVSKIDTPFPANKRPYDYAVV